MDLDYKPLEQMSEEEQEFLTGIAEHLIAVVVNAEKEVAHYIAGQRLDQEEYLAVWGLLPSKVRTAIKRGSGEA